jgi:hypothetical protein
MDDTHPANTDFDPSTFADLNVSHSGLIVDDSDDDDPVLLKSDGEHVDTWREGYPYPERLSGEVYASEKRLHDQAIHGAPQSPRSARGRIGEAKRA